MFAFVLISLSQKHHPDSYLLYWFPIKKSRFLLSPFHALQKEVQVTLMANNLLAKNSALIYLNLTMVLDSSSADGLYQSFN